MESRKVDTAGESRKIPFYEAGKLVETFTHVAARTSHGAAVKVSTTSIAS